MRNSIVLLLLITLFISGCIEVEQEVWIHYDGSGKIRVKMGKNASLQKLTSEDQLKSRQTKREAIQKKLLAHKNIQSVKLEEYESDNRHWEQFTLELNDIRKLQEHQQDISQLISPEDQSQIPLESATVEIVAKPGGSYFIKYKLTEANYKKKANPLTQGMLKGHYFTFRLHAPEISSANGLLFHHKKTAEWKIPLTDIINPKEDIEIRAEINPLQIPLYLIIGAILAICLIGYFVLFRKKS